MRILAGSRFNDAIVANASSLVGTTLVTSGLGFVYWWLAARQFSPEAVGLAAAAIAPMTLLANVAMLGLGTLLMGELPRERGNAGPLITTALVVAGAAGAALGVAFALLGPVLSAELRPLASSAASAGLFAVGVSLTTVTLVLDQSLIGLLRGDLQFGRNALFALVKLLALIPASLWLAERNGMVIYATWACGNLISLMVLAGLAKGRAIFHRPQWGLLRRIGKSALAHHALNLTLQAPSLALPIVVTLTLSTTATAYFYTNWMIAGFAFIAPFALSLALYATGSADPDKFVHKIRFTLGSSLVIGLLANLALLLGASWVLRLFGAAYADYGAPSLRILAFGVWPLVIKDHYVALHRTSGRVGSATLLLAAGGAMELIMAGAGALIGGLEGLTLGWVAAVCLEAAVMIRGVYRAANHHHAPVLESGDAIPLELQMVAALGTHCSENPAVR